MFFTDRFEKSAQRDDYFCRQTKVYATTINVIVFSGLLQIEAKD
jgi:hypothetical protein